jgi:hypothetical protein
MRNFRQSIHPRAGFEHTTRKSKKAKGEEEEGGRVKG